MGLVRVSGRLWQTVQRRLQREFEQPLRKPTKRSVWQKLLDRQPTVAELIQRRALAAEALARIESGGSGLQPAFWRQPYGEPVWIIIPAGEFWMGEGGEAHRVHLTEYQIARVPVTNTQYSLFVEATKHEPPSGWNGSRPPKGQESHPVVNVSWNDALAYCRWLSKMTGKEITLPSEAQWEKAARGDEDKRAYPWGDQWDETKCNTDELGLGDTTPVGIFPEGASPYGCLEMAGNVWEWTTTIYKEYPYDPTDGRESLEAGTDVLLVVRGGSWFDIRYYARCAFREGYRPSSWYDALGFRVVVAAISQTSAPSTALRTGL